MEENRNLFEPVTFNTDVTFKELWESPPFLDTIDAFINIMARQYNENDAIVELNKSDPISCGLLILSLFDRIERYYNNERQFNNELAYAITKVHVVAICANVLMLHKDVAEIINNVICGKLKPDDVTNKMAESIIDVFYKETESVAHLSIDAIC